MPGFRLWVASACLLCDGLCFAPRSALHAAAFAGVLFTERAVRFPALGVSVPEPAAHVVHCLWPHIRVAALPLADRHAVVFRCRMHCGYALSLPVILLPSSVG